MFTCKNDEIPKNGVSISQSNVDTNGKLEPIGKLTFNVNCQGKLERHLRLKKETLAQVFSCEFCEIFEHLFYRTPLGNSFNK